MTLGPIVDPSVRDTARRWENPSWWNLLVVLPWTLAAIFLGFHWHMDRVIAARQQTSTGTITAQEPAHHNRYQYVFSVNGRQFAGWGSPVTDGREVGNSIVVYYDPLDPARNSPEDFHTSGVHKIETVPVILFAIGAAALCIQAARRRQRPSAPRDSSEPSQGAAS